MSYFNFPKRQSKTAERQKLVRKVDDAFSDVIRLRDADENGMVKCITCGDEYHWTLITCGHFVKRGNMATRYNLKACGPQCGLCNSTHDGKEDEHAAYIDRTYGEGTAESLRKIGREEKHYAEFELQGMLEELRKEVKNLKIEKFG
jgi:hypothetical protein